MTSVNVNKKKRVRISSPGGSNSDDRVKENPESEKRDTCFVCDGKDDWVLVCHGEECFISVHQSCTCDEPDFDEFGNFFCPYCWYKRLVLKSSKIRERLSVIDKPGAVDLGDGVSGNVNVSQGRRECDESYEQFMAMEKDQRRREVTVETQSQEVGRFSGKNHVSEDGDGFDLEDKDDEQIEEHPVPVSTDNVQELALVIHHPIEAQPFRSVPPRENGTAALREHEQRKRKRVFWTQAEEEMLKVGVQKFPGVRNIPWRKILEFGRDVFHEDRAPSDLKDKWKNIVKMSFEGPRRGSGKLPLDNRQPNHQ